MVEVHLYGRLRRFGPELRGDKDTVVKLKLKGGETVGDVLKRLGIPAEEIAHVFLNGRLLTTCNSMAPWLRYQKVEEGLPTGKLNFDYPVREGDRLGLFGRDMAMLVV